MRQKQSEVIREREGERGDVREKSFGCRRGTRVCLSGTGVSTRVCRREGQDSYLQEERRECVEERDMTLSCSCVPLDVSGVKDVFKVQEVLRMCGTV